MPRHKDVVIREGTYRITPIDVLDGDWVLKLLLDTDIPQQLSSVVGPEFQGPKGRTMTRDEWKQVQRLMLAQCMEVEQVSGAEALTPCMAPAGQIMGKLNSDLMAVHKLIGEAIKFLILDPFSAELQAKGKAQA